MINLGVKYMGLELKSPIIASSSGITSKIITLGELEKVGVGAIVLKSLFEEQILGEITHTEQYSDYPESSEYLNAYIKENSINDYLSLIREAKKTCSVPIIASICCVHSGEWRDFAKDIESAGADAVELNIFFMPTSGEEKSSDLEKAYLAVAAEVAEILTIPVAVKISSHFTNPINIARELYFRKVKGVVMFNRMYDPDIDIETMSIKASNIFSQNDELRHALRWIAMSSAVQPEIDYSASTGVHSGGDVIKMLLAGANSVQVCTTIYKNGVEEVTKMNEEIRGWMKRQNYTSIDQFRGKLNYNTLENSVAYERSQFMKYYSSHK